MIQDDNPKSNPNPNPNLKKSTWSIRIQSISLVERIY